MGKTCLGGRTYPDPLFPTFHRHDLIVTGLIAHGWSPLRLSDTTSCQTRLPFNKCSTARSMAVETGISGAVKRISHSQPWLRTWGRFAEAGARFDGRSRRARICCRLQTTRRDPAEHLLKAILKPTLRTEDEVTSVLAVRLGSVLGRPAESNPKTDTWDNGRSIFRARTATRIGAF